MSEENKLNEYLKKKGKSGETPAKKTSESKPEEKKKVIIINGKEFDVEKHKGYRQVFIRKPEKTKQLPSTFVVPGWVRKFINYSDGLSEKQKEYKRRVIDKKTLLEQTPKTTKSKNPEWLHSYIFFTELFACKNGFLYYTLPLVISIILLVINAFRFDFWVNAIFSFVVLLDYILIKRTLKSQTLHPVLKTLLFILIVVLNIGALVAVSFSPDIMERLRIRFAVQILMIIFGVYHFGKFHVDFMRMYAHDCGIDFGNTVKIKAGKPRSGKTSSAVQDAIILAKIKWKELKYDWWLMKSREKKIFKKGDPDELFKYHETKIAYEFYASKKCIPCLWSNIGIFDKKGRAAYKVTLEHIKGLDRLPVYSVVVLDEIGAMLKAEDGLKRTGFENPVDVSDMFRLGGHFLKWVVIGCEQDFNHIFIDCRRVVGVNELIEGQEWICRPTLLWNVFKFLQMLKVDELDSKVNKNPKYADFMYNFEKFVRSIGFRKITYSHVGNTQTKAKVSGSDDENKILVMGQRRTRICPATLAGDYDDRAYKQKYPSYFDKEIVGELHKHKYIEAVDENTAAFVNTTAALSEKRDAQKEAIKEIT